MSEFEQAYTALGGAAAIKSVVTKVLEREPALIFPTTAKNYVALVAEDGAQIGLYAERKVLAIALDPEAAADVNRRTGVRCIEKTPQTWYLRASAEELVDATVADAIIDAGVLALGRCRNRFVADRAAGRTANRPSPGVCLTDNYELLPNGECSNDRCPSR